MNEKKWDMFFDLLGEIVDIPGKTADEKAEIVGIEARKRDAEGNLEELQGWDCSEAVM